MSDKNNHIETLDGLRGVAILLILAYHSVITYFILHPEQVYNYDAATNFTLKLFSLFWCGVDLFFVLSGFLITRILLNTKEATNYFKAFYGRRVLRIFPLYYAFLCVHFFIITPLLIKGGVKEELTGYNDQIFYWLYLSNFVREPSALSHMWSLAVEEQFYLIWPLFVYFLSRDKLIRACFFIIFLSLVSRFLFCISGDFTYAYAMTFTRADPIMMGSLVALIKIELDNKKLVKIALGLLSVIFLLYGTFLFDFARPLVASFSTNERILHSTFRHFFAGLVFAILLIIALREVVTPLHKICTAKTLKVFGKYSYSIYVCHVFIIFGIIKSPLNFSNLQGMMGIPAIVALMLQFVICSLLSLLAAMLTWYLLEVHFLRMKKMFTYKFADQTSKID